MLDNTQLFGNGKRSWAPQFETQLGKILGWGTDLLRKICSFDTQVLFRVIATVC